MRKIKGVIFISMFLLIQGYFGAIDWEVGASEDGNEASEGDSEIIENLDFLDNMDLFKEDIEFLEDYKDVDQVEPIGEGDE